MIGIVFKYVNKFDLNRKNGPCIVTTGGYVAWYLDNKRHRIDGPAMIWSDGSEEYFLNDKQYTKEEYYEKLKELNINK